MNLHLRTERAAFIAWIDQYGPRDDFMTAEWIQDLKAGLPVAYATHDRDSEGRITHSELVWIDDEGGKPTKIAKTSTGPVDLEAKRRFAEALDYVKAYTGTFGLILDLKAEHAKVGPKYFSMSERQVEAVLNSKAREEAWSVEAALNHKDPDHARAVAFLSSYTGTFDFLNDLKARIVSSPSLSERQVQAVLKCAAKEAPTTSHFAQDPGFKIVAHTTKDGFYKKGETIFKVQFAVHGSGNLYAKKLIVSQFGHATWEYAPGAITTLYEDDRLTLEAAQVFGRLYGVCGVCGRTLTDEGSIAAGIGPVCASRL